MLGLLGLLGLCGFYVGRVLLLEESNGMDVAMVVFFFIGSTKFFFRYQRLKSQRGLDMIDDREL